MTKATDSESPSFLASNQGSSAATVGQASRGNGQMTLSTPNSSASAPKQTLAGHAMAIKEVRHFPCAQCKLASYRLAWQNLA